MKICIFSSEKVDIWRSFVNLYSKALAEHGITIDFIVLDQNTGKKKNFLSHAVKVAKRQAKYAGCPWLVQFFNIFFYKLFVSSNITVEQPVEDIELLYCESLNSDKVIEKVKSCDIDLVCLMGASIIHKATLEALEGITFINIHASDPAFVRGGPPVFWEILDQKNHISPTIHRVISQLDAGEIYAQDSVEIEYHKDLSATIKKTMKRAVPVICKLFYDVIMDFKANRIQSQTCRPGPLRVTPSSGQLIDAGRVCRAKSKG